MKICKLVGASGIRLPTALKCGNNVLNISVQMGRNQEVVVEKEKKCEKKRKECGVAVVTKEVGEFLRLSNLGLLPSRERLASSVHIHLP